MKHHLRLAQYAILGAFALFLLFIVLFSFEGQLAGRATTATTANVTASTPTNCTLQLSQGYNIISLPCLSSADLVTNVTNGTPIRVMYQYVPNGPDRWKVYNPDLPSYVVSDLQYMTRRAGYIVIANESVTKTVVGRRVAFTDIPLVRGWNLVGYPSFTQNSTPDVLADINASYSIIIGYNTTAGSYVNYTPDGSGDLVVITPGEGYWVNATQVDSWTVIA